MDGITRRRSGVYVARLVVPHRLRHAVGQTEMIASTGVRDLAVAKIVGGQLIATWRRRFLELERMMRGGDIDVLRAAHGSPVLALQGYLPLDQAAVASGIGQDMLLRGVLAGRLKLYFQAFKLRGHRLPLEALQKDQAIDEAEWKYIVPQPWLLPSSATAMAYTGNLAIGGARDVAQALLLGQNSEVVLFVPLDVVGDVFVPEGTICISRESVFVAAAEVERERRKVAAVITEGQLEGARASKLAAVTPGISPNRQRPLSESIDAFMADHKRPRGAEQSERVRAACRLFLDLMGVDLRGSDLSRELIREFRDEHLPLVPASENKVRLKHGTRSVADSIKVIAGTEWPRMSVAQQVKRMTWVGGWIDWLGNEGWAVDNLTEGLVGAGLAGRSAAKQRSAVLQQDKRDAFDAEDLQKIFGATWFCNGAGDLTANDTYRTWMPYRTWLPLLGLLTGARLNELAQLRLADIKENDAGVWLIEISDDSSSAAATTKKLKNAQSRRKVPVHSELIRIGLLAWCDRLESKGFDRLFPELLHDEHKGYGKAVTKWFSRYMASLGYPRDLRKVFHSFRHTVADALENDDTLKSEIVSQLLGHERGSTTTQTTYRKDADAFAPNSPLVRAVETLRFDCLSRVAAFDCDAGMLALQHALARKRGGRGLADTKTSG